VRSWSENLRSNFTAPACSIGPTPSTLSGLISSIMARNWRARTRSYLRKNQAWPSAATRVVVTNRGGSEKSRLKSAW